MRISITIALLALCALTATAADPAPDPKPISGLIDVPDAKAKMFWLFYPVATQPENTPILLWIHSKSSTQMAFYEIGPYKYDAIAKQEVLREAALTSDFNLLFLDAQYPNGYSVLTEGSIPKNSQAYAVAVNKTLQNLFGADLQAYAKTPLYIVAEGKAAKLGIAIADAFSKSRGTVKVTVRLMSLMIIRVLRCRMVTSMPTCRLERLAQRHTTSD
jgi:hypothetical protein